MSEELKNLKATVEEFIRRSAAIDNEIETLKEDKKTLIEEFKTRVDMKTLNAALRVVKIRSKVEHKSTFDAMMEVLEDPSVS